VATKAYQAGSGPDSAGDGSRGPGGPGGEPEAEEAVEGEFKEV
jgi:hypothetical protein